MSRDVVAPIPFMSKAVGAAEAASEAGRVSNLYNKNGPGLLEIQKRQQQQCLWGGIPSGIRRRLVIDKIGGNCNNQTIHWGVSRSHPGPISCWEQILYNGPSVALKYIVTLFLLCLFAVKKGWSKTYNVSVAIKKKSSLQLVLLRLWHSQILQPRLVDRQVETFCQAHASIYANHPAFNSGRAERKHLFRLQDGDIALCRH